MTLSLSHRGRRVTANDEATTTLRLHVVADFSETVRAGAEKGWASQLDKLAELFAAASSRARNERH
jgi:hypothetical protein